MASVELLTQRIQSVLRDANADSWPDDSVHDAILEAEKIVTIFRPDATPIDVTHTLVAGIKQDISALNPTPNRLLAFKYNRAGDVDGRSVRRVAVGDLDSIRPNWRSSTASTTVREVMHDDREPLIYYVNPPAATGAKLQISYSAIPAPYGTVDEDTQTTVSDLYEPMLIEWALYRLFGHDVEGSVNIARSQQHLQTFESTMGVKVSADMLASPKNPEHRK